MVSGAVRRLLGDETGFGLLELLIAMGVLAIAISAQLAVFSSSYTSLSRANMKGAAVTVADKQMETYRTLPYSCVYLTSAGRGQHLQRRQRIFRVAGDRLELFAEHDPGHGFDDRFADRRRPGQSELSRRYVHRHDDTDGGAGTQDGDRRRA